MRLLVGSRHFQVAKADSWVARNVGIEVQWLVRGVFEIEIELQNWTIAERRRHFNEARDEHSLEDSE